MRDSVECKDGTLLRNRMLLDKEQGKTVTNEEQKSDLKKVEVTRSRKK